MTDFTREQLLKFVARASWEPDPVMMLFKVSMFAITLLDRVEKAEAEIDNHESWLTTQQAATYAAEAELDRLQRALDLSEQSHREVREVCERHGVANALALSVRLESVCDERDRLRAQLDSILANSDSLESGKLADANAEIARLREELAEAEATLSELVQKVLGGRVADFNHFPRRTIVFAESYVSEMRNRPAVRRARERAGRG